MNENKTYSPDSSVLFVTICSLHKKKGGIQEYNAEQSMMSRVSPETAQNLITSRDEVRSLIWNGSVEWQGIETAELEYNSNLGPGKDFGGTADWVDYLPAIDRYTGRFYRTLGQEGIQKLLSSHHHVLFISGLYGVVTPVEPIQLYSCPVVGTTDVKKVWSRSGAITDTLVDYIQKNNISRVYDFTATADYRDLVDWNRINEETEADVLYCFTKMSAHDYALIEFGDLFRDHFLEGTEDHLLKIEPGMEFEGVVFRDVPETLPSLPHEKEIEIITNAAGEIPNLETYSVTETPSKLGIADDSTTRLADGDWVVAFTSEFQKNLHQYNDKKLQGRVLEAINVLSKNPVERKGDTIKSLKGPLAGKWRYRIGDYRLVYVPDTARKVISLVAIRPRGEVYDS